MPTVQAGSLILVTGASGFIATWSVKELLDRGHRVRGTVRSEAKGQILQDLFKNSDFSYVIAEDLEKPGVFDEAVKDVDGVAHLASPFHFKVEDNYKDLINPAVNGTMALLESANKYGNNVKRVVITSSFASMHMPVEPPHTFTEEDWNTRSTKEVETKGNDDSAADAYMASKTLAEKAAWEFMSSGKSKKVLRIEHVSFNDTIVGEALSDLAEKEKDGWKYVLSA